MARQDEEIPDAGRPVPKARVRSWARVGHRACQSRLAKLNAPESPTKAAGQANRRLGQQNRLYKELLDSDSIGLVVFRGENTRGRRAFRIVWANRAVFNLSGKRQLTAADVVGQTIAAIFPCVCENDFSATLMSIVRSGRPQLLGEIHCAGGRDTSQILSIYAFPLRGHCAAIALENVTRTSRMHFAVL